MATGQQIEMIVNAGFNGVDIVYGDIDRDTIGPLLDHFNLANTVTAFPQSIDALRPAIEFAQSPGTRHLNVIGKVYPFGINQGAEIVREWMALCDKAGLPMTIETHRDCITCRHALYIQQLMEQVPEVQICVDMSNFVVGREFSWPITVQVQAQIESILDRSIAFQERVASREQIQLQISFDHHREWFDLFAQWWEYGFMSRQRRAENDATLNFLCEAGPREYAMTGAGGFKLSDRWQESLIIMDRVRSIWDRL